MRRMWRSVLRAERARWGNERGLVGQSGNRIWLGFRDGGFVIVTLAVSFPSCPLCTSWPCTIFCFDALSLHIRKFKVRSRLAVAMEHRGRSFGAALLKDAISRTLAAAEIAGIRAVALHAKDVRVQSFQTHFGFWPFPVIRRTSSSNSRSHQIKGADLDQLAEHLSRGGSSFHQSRQQGKVTSAGSRLTSCRPVRMKGSWHEEIPSPDNDPWLIRSGIHWLSWNNPSGRPRMGATKRSKKVGILQKANATHP